MSQPKPYASTTYSSTTSLPSSSSTISTAQINQPLPQTRRREPSQTNEYTLPATTFSAFVGGGNNTYTYSRKGEHPRNDHRARAHEHEHEHSRNDSDVVPIPSKATFLVGSSNINHNNFHYQQKSRQQPVTTGPKTRNGLGGETYYNFDVDDDIDRDDDEDEEEEEENDDLHGNGTKNNEDMRIAFDGEQQQHQQQQQLKAKQLKSVFSSDYLYKDSDSSIKQYANNKKDLERDRDQFHHQSQSQLRILQSRVGGNNNFLMNSNNFNWNQNGNGGGGSSSSSSSNNITNKSTEPTTTHQIQPNSRHYQRQQPRQYYNDHNNTTSTIGNGTHHQPRASVSNSNWNRPNRDHSHPRNPHPHPHSRQQQQQQHLLPQQHPRAASSSAFYNTNSYSNSTSPPPPPSRTRTGTSRTSPPSAPPRVSSLLPPPRNSNTTTNSPRIPLSIINTSTTPIIPEQLVLPATINTNSNSNSNPDPVSTTTTSPSSNALIQDVPTHAQFATSFLDPLNNNHNQSTVSDTASALATDSGSGAASGGAGPGPGPGPGPRRSQSHSRASSIGAVGDSLRNLNRWSSSTASSRLSAWDYHHYQQQQAQQQKLTSFARRMSVDSIGLLSQHSDSIQDILPPNHSSPRKLSKRRPSEGTSASPKSRARAGSASAFASGLALGGGVAAGSGAIANFRPDRSPPLQPSSAPPPNLPPIISLPPLDTNPESKLRLGSPTPRAMSRASPGGLNTPNSVFANQRGNGEPQDYFWGDLSNPTRTASPAMRANPTLLPPAPVARDRDVTPERREHSRSRSAAKGSGDSTKIRDRSSKPSQKAMLSKALNKANAAVQLDNEQNYGAAREAYIEACELLQQVLARTNGEDDRKKLEAIQRTYTSRIEELDGLVPVNPQGDKALPARPDSFNYHGVQMELAGVDGQSDAATITRSHRDESPNSQVSSHPMHRPSESTTTYSDSSHNADVNQGPRQSSFSRSPMRRNFEGTSLAIPRSNDFLPAPLSPRRPISPARASSPDPIVRQDFSLTSERERLAAAPDFRTHRRNLSHESASWLDPIDESGGSTASSVHSRSSSRVMRRHIRQPSGDTEAEFNAALDTAIEAAYDDGYEPMEPSTMTYDEVDDDRIASSMRRVELAKERVRESEREAAIETARERERQRQISLSQESQTYGGDFFDANDSDEEEERMLEEMTRGYVMEDFALGQKSRYQSSVPRESDSSGLTSRTWHSSMGSNPPTGTTTLSTVSEMTSPNNHHKTSSPPFMPPPTQSLPQLPPNRPSSSTGVRNRRLSGQNTKQLKIETSKLGPPPNMPPPPINTSLAMQSKPTGGYIAQQRQALSATSTRPGPFSMRVPTSPVRGISPADAAYPTSPPDGEDEEVRTGSPSSIQLNMRKNFSSSSLKSLKSRQLSTVSHMDDPDHSPMTPLSQQVSNTSISRQPTMPTLPTPIAATFGDKISLTGPLGGLHLFDYDFHAPVAHSPTSTHHHQQQSPDIPLPLEPCPSDAMFRPFWLMRALYQTLVHPRGGYISNRLFIPRDAWKVKGVKLRNVEDKVSQCDLLTAALLKLALVDSTDADAVLDEMQSLENILEMVQATLIRKLGTEVGTQGMPTFKEEKESEVPSVPRNNSVSGKTGAFSWRRLRSKGSAVNLANTYGVRTNTGGGGTSGVAGIPERDLISPGGSMPSLPMVAHPSSRPAKRDVASAKFDGPNANYMASLARLFDAAQAVDQIARQVDDPGLRHADKTQVGLELCTRHAAEFFGFYIVRFVLTDLGMLLDKFVKRGSEWVLS